MRRRVPLRWIVFASGLALDFEAILLSLSWNGLPLAMQALLVFAALAGIVMMAGSTYR